MKKDFEEYRKAQDSVPLVAQCVVRQLSGCMHHIHMDHVSLVAVPVLGCVMSPHKLPRRIRKYLFIQEVT